MEHDEKNFLNETFNLIDNLIKNDQGILDLMEYFKRNKKTLSKIKENFISNKYFIYDETQKILKQC